MKRRDFLKNAGIGLAGIPVAPVLAKSPPNPFVAPELVASEMLYDWNEWSRPVGYAAGDSIQTDSGKYIVKMALNARRTKEELIKKIFTE
jgi:hypothetical protein